MSDIIQKQVDDIQEQDFKRLRELSILVLSFTVAFFIYCLNDIVGLENWSANWYAPNYYEELYFFIHLYEIGIFFVGLSFLIAIVSYFWWLQSKPQFHVLFIERKEKQIPSNATGLFMLGLILVVGISTGLSSFVLFDNSVVLPYLPVNYYYFLYASPSLFYLRFLMWSLIVGACISILLYIIYRIKPDRVQRSLRWSLLIPIFLSILMAGWKAVLSSSYSFWKVF